MARKNENILARIDSGRISGLIASMGGQPRPDSLDEILDPGLKQISRMTDDELAEIVAREPASKFGHLAARVIRQRESWTTPAKWALLVSICSFGLAAIALIRTFL